MKNFGFGCMRLPMIENQVDHQQVIKMVDLFMENGFNYFDTARGYIGGASEKALKECLTSRYPRESYILTNKLTAPYFNSREEIRPFFQSQLETCGVTYFDYYLMHAQSKEIFQKFQECQAYEEALELKKEGKIKHFGISFHDNAQVLESILQAYPQIEVVQIQFNYVDYEDAAVQGRDCYEVCRKYKKPIIVMEPTKGGNLVNLPEDAKEVLENLGDKSVASYAIRYAAGFEGIEMVLSGMSNIEQMEDNISYMKDFQPLNEKELEAVHKVCEIFKSKNMIPCTACRYCIEDCPKKISIPDLFACLNMKKVFQDWNTDYYYHHVYTVHNGKASDCINCGKCEKSCPQYLPIRELLVQVKEEFEVQA